MPRTLYLDLETFSETPIKDGTYRYAADAEIMLAAYAWDDDPVTVRDLTDDATRDDIAAEIDKADIVVIHNSMFDRTVLGENGIALPVERIHDTMVQAYCHGLPGSLGVLSEIFGLPVDKAKDKAGKELVQLFCKPRPKTAKIHRATRLTHPIEWQRFKDYAGLDVEAMRALYKKLPRWNYPDGIEYQRWVLDQQINDRGFAVDVELAEAAVRATEAEKKRLAVRTQELTDGEVSSATKRDALLRHILEQYGVDLPDMKKDTLERRLEDQDLPWPVRELIGIRLQSATASTAKYKAMLKAVVNGRMHGTLQFSGAQRTGRWAGRTFQPQNLPRPDMKQHQIEAAIEAFKLGVEDIAVEDIMRAGANALRGLLVAGRDKKLVVSDLSNIEGRMLAWLAGEEWKLQAFRDYDTVIGIDDKGKPIRKGHDLYKLTASSILVKRPEDIDDDERQAAGKVPELACGYQGASGAFASMAAIYGLDLPEYRVKEIVRSWRAANPNIVSLWAELDNAVRIAINVPGRVVECRKVKVRRDGAWLRIILPSGRALCYPSPRIENDKITYMGMSPYSKRWTRLKTYGGKLVENITQACAAEVLKENMSKVEAAGYQIVLSVHDELITETPQIDGENGFSAKQLSHIMAWVPVWAQGLPLSAGGFEGLRYRKGS
ncbi:hypothetical protein [Dongia sp.]|uniref:hypothetical protein n=1 Tax=Dongia sp. TaxID=1977262 RepID=UPI0035AE38F8